MLFMLAVGFFFSRSSQLLYLKDFTADTPLRDAKQWTAYELLIPDLLLPFCLSACLGMDYSNFLNAGPKCCHTRIHSNLRVTKTAPLPMGCSNSNAL